MLCTVVDCSKVVLAKCLCARHYQLNKRRNNAKRCKIPGCGASHEARGLCSAHWQRLYKNGTTDISTMHGSSVMARLLNKIEVNAKGCWIFTGARSKGYGMIGVEGKVKLAHIVTYEDKYGQIPIDLELHHYICNDKACCNPDHVKPLTRSEHKLEHADMQRDK